MIRFLYLYLSIAVILLFSYCSNSTSSDEKEDNVDVFYSNSFESPSDTIGWKGNIELNNDTPRNGGNKSIRVSGGCIWPHTYFLFHSIREDCSLIIRCWGKDLLIGGSVYLGNIENPYEGIYINVDNKSWYKYTSLDTLICHASDTLMISLNSGGDNPSAMIIDNIEIIKVK